MLKRIFTLLKRIFTWLTRGLLIILVAGIVYMHLPDMPSLPTKTFLTLPGSATAIVPIGDEVYVIYRSRPQGSPYGSLYETDYSVIARMPLADFLTDPGKPKSRTRMPDESLCRVPGAIMAAVAAPDGKSLYYAARTLENEDIKYVFYSFNPATNTSSVVGPFHGFAHNIITISEDIFIDCDNLVSSISYDRGKSWKRITSNKVGKKSNYYSNGDMYYSLDRQISKIPHASIINGTLEEIPLVILPKYIDYDYIFIDADSQMYVTTVQDKIPMIYHLPSLRMLPLWPKPIERDNILFEPIHKHGNSFYGILWAANHPIGDNARLVKVTGDEILATKPETTSQTFLGVVGDYLIFNQDVVFKRKSEVLGIRYK